MSQRFLEWFLNFLKTPQELEKANERILQLTNELDGYQKQIDYSFIPEDWKRVDENVTTRKTQMDGIDIELDVRDLLNSTVYSREWALEVIKNVKKNYFWKDNDEMFNHLALAAANLVIVLIKYQTNMSQFKVMDRWNNGDTAIVMGRGDCDISARVFVRILDDALDRLKLFEYKKYVFQGIGFWGSIGHSWAFVYNPVTKRFNLVECTRDEPYEELKEFPNNYSMYFCLNFKYVYYKNKGWRDFL